MSVNQKIVNHRFIVTHGSTFTSPETSYNFNNTHFNCPSNIKVVLFEQFGKLFKKIDSGYIFNYIINGIEMGYSIDDLDNHRIKIPIRDTKEYYCKVYTNGMLIPNIAFTFSDPSTQVGIFNFRDNRTNSINRATYYPIYERNGLVSWEVKYNPAFIDYKLTNALLGNTQMIGKLVFYQNTRTSLEQICKTIQRNLGPNEEYTLYIISCRYFESPKMNIVENQYENSMNKLSKCGSIFYKTNDLVKNYYNNVILQSNDITSYNKLMFNSIVSNLQNDFNNCINDYINRNIKIFEDFKQTYDDLIMGVANYPLDEYMINMPEQYVFEDEQELHSIISPITQYDYLKYLYDNDMFTIQLYTNNVAEIEMTGGNNVSKKYVIDLQYYRDLIDTEMSLNDVLKELYRNYKE